MIRILSLLLFVTFLQPAIAQNTDSLPPYQKSYSLPAFKLFAAPDSIAITEADLKPHRPVMFILFSPDCDHCKRAFTDLINNISLYKEVTIVMCSALRYDLICDFYIEHHVAGYPNIIMGRDPGNKLSSFFVNRSFPGIFIYDKKGKFSFEIRRHPDFKQIAEMIR